MKIKRVEINNRKKCLEVETAKGFLGLPYSKLRLQPSDNNRIANAYVDKELSNRAVTYVLESGEEDSVPLEGFLEYNQEPDYMRKVALYDLTLRAHKAVEEYGLSKREIIRKLKTSPSQLYRLLDTTNYTKTIDQMLRLLAGLGCEVSFVTKSASASNPDSVPVASVEEQIGNDQLAQKFAYLDADEIAETPKVSKFKPLIQKLKDAA